MKLVSSKRSINACSNAFICTTISRSMLHSCFWYRLARYWHYSILYVATYSICNSHPYYKCSMLLAHAGIIYCMVPHQIIEIKFYILRDILRFFRHYFNRSSVIYFSGGIICMTFTECLRPKSHTLLGQLFDTILWFQRFLSSLIVIPIL